MNQITPKQLLKQAGIDDIATLEHLEGMLPEMLFGPQRAFLVEGGLMEGESAVVVAPTGAGKSLVADLAALPHLRRGRQTIFLTPTRALAAERAENLERLFGPLGFRVALSTSEERRADDDIRAGRVDVIVAVYEKGQGLFLASPMLRRSAGLIVADEVQLAQDPLRGPMIELLLRLWRLQGDKPQILAMTSEMEHVEDFAAEHGLKLLRSHDRQVPLRVGRINLAAGTGTWTCDTEDESGAVSLPMGYHDMEDFLAGIVDFAECFEGPVIAFTATRGQALRLATSLAAARHGESEPPSEGAGLLGWMMERGVAYHSTDLTRRERRVVEESVRQGEVDWCFCTTTLAEGVNLAAKTVLVLSPDGGFPRPIGNLFGRAGRPGAGAGMAWECRFHWDYAGQRTEWMAPSQEDMVAAGMQAVAFALRACMPPLTREGVERTLGSAARRLPLKAALERGLRWGLWRQDDEGLRILPPGEMAARGGLDPSAICAWRTVLRRFPKGGGLASNLFLAFGSARGRPIPLSRDERVSARWIMDLRQHLTREKTPLGRHFLDYLESPDHLPRTTHEAAKATLLAMALMEGMDAHGAAARFRLPAGMAEELQQTATYLLGQLNELAEIMGSGLGSAAHDSAKQAKVVAIPLAPLEPRLVLRVGATGQVRVNGVDVHLTRTQFRLLELLARHPGDGIPYERIERYVWQDAIVERQQISFHKSNIDKRLRDAGNLVEPLIETLPGWGMRLALSQEDVRIDDEGAAWCLEEDENADSMEFNSIAGEVCL